MNIIEKVSTNDLGTTDIFERLSNDILEQLAGLCTHIVYEAGEYCAVQGDKIDHIMIVNGGKVAIEMRIEVPPHIHVVTIATLTKGKVCAWSALAFLMCLPPR
jgi:CRP-like cAMP-binding protein